jgi:dihydroneopterin aldolase
MSKINIVDLEVFLHVGVTDEERAKPQRILLTVKMDLDFTSASRTDRIAETIDYFAVAQRLLKYGREHSWNLIEKLAADMADVVLSEFDPKSVTVEVKKFPIPQARHVSVSVTRESSGGELFKRAALGNP